MPKILSVALGTAATAAVLGAGAVSVGHLRFRRQVGSEVAALLERGRTASRKIVCADDLAGLPPPVQRWLVRANVVGRPRPGIVYLTQTGIMRGEPDQPWMPVRAEQYFTTDPPGFEWIATMHINPLAWVTGRDRYFDGQGAMEMLAMSLVPVVHARGPELNQGVLLRYLTETVWFPAAVLTPYITWQPIDNLAARATLEYLGTRASATFIIDDNGAVLQAEAERYREEHGKYALRPWSIPITEYGEFAGTRMPVAGDAIWGLDSGDLPYYRWRITSVTYDGPTSLTEPLHTDSSERLMVTADSA
jgi:hypothetical protein